MALDKKQIALSVVGILASLTLAYLLWRVSERDSAANAAAAAAADSDSTDTAEYNQEVQEESEQSFLGQYQSGGSSDVGSGSGLVDVSTGNEDSASSGSGTSGSDSTDLVSQVLSALMSGPGISQPSTTNLEIPQVDDLTGAINSTAVNGIPTTEAGAVTGNTGTESTTNTTGNTTGLSGTLSNQSQAYPVESGAPIPPNGPGIRNTLLPSTGS